MKILFLAFEGEARPIADLAKRFKSKGHEVFLVSCDHFNVTHSRGEVFEYFRSVGLQESEFTNLDRVFRELNALPIELEPSLVDWDYLRSFEERNCQRFSLLELASMDPLLSGAFHHRNIYFRPSNQALFFKYLEMLARWLDGVFGMSGFHVIFTINFQYFVKALAFCMGEARGIPFVTLATCRIADLYLAYENFTLGTPESVLGEMDRLRTRKDPCLDAQRYMEGVVQSRKPAYSDFEKTLEAMRERWGLGSRIGELWRILTRYPKSVLLVHKHYRGLLRRNYFLPGYWALVRTMYLAIWRRFAYFRHEELVGFELPSSPFVYFPLHLIPENSVLTLSPTRNELECLFQLSKALPVGWEVVVKVNPSMLSDLDTHPTSYYREMAKLPNVRFANPLMPSSALLAKASAVACISGTALLEGAIYGIPAFRWGRTEFEVVDSVFEFRREDLRDQLVPRESQNLLQYVQACFNLGVRLDMRAWNVPLAEEGTAEQREEFRRQLDLMESAILARVHRPASPS